MCVLYSSSTNTFKESDAFIGYQKDTPASVIFHASNQLRRACSAARDSKSNASSLSQRVCRILQQSRLSPAQFDVEERNPTMWADMVSFGTNNLVLEIMGCSIVIFVSSYVQINTLT